jgi:hypothetical protein
VSSFSNLQKMLARLAARTSGILRRIGYCRWNLIDPVDGQKISFSMESSLTLRVMHRAGADGRSFAVVQPDAFFFVLGFLKGKQD